MLSSKVPIQAAVIALAKETQALVVGFRAGNWNEQTEKQVKRQRWADEWKRKGEHGRDLRFHALSIRMMERS